MQGAVEQGLVGTLRSASGLVGGDAAKLVTGPAGPLAGTPFRDILARALAVQEVNAAMGVIVAAPTAGGAGVLPAVLTGLAAARGSVRRRGWSMRWRPRDSSAPWSPSVRRCPAPRAGARRRRAPRPEWPPARHGDARRHRRDRSAHAVALAQQGTLGLVCDPLGGLVELPCVFRNATGAAIALAAIEMALAGITFAIPADEVIDTMGEIGREMDVRYRETAGGGLAATPTGRRLARERLVQIKRG